MISTGGAGAERAEMIEQEDHRKSGRRAAERQQAGHPPDHRAVEAMHRGADRFGRGGIEKIGADGGGRVNAEQQHENRRHQRPAADAGDADHQTNEKP